MIKAINLVKTANKKNKKSRRSNVLFHYKKIKKVLKLSAKKGNYNYSFTFYLNDGIEPIYTLSAFRLFRFKHRDFKVSIRGLDLEGYECDSFWNSVKVAVKIKFD